MDNNTVGILIFIIIISVLVSFALGYYYAMNKTENKFLNAQIKITEAKMNTIKNMQRMKAIEVKEEDLPKGLKQMLDNIFKEEENNEKSKKD